MKDFNAHVVKYIQKHRSVSRQLVFGWFELICQWTTFVFFRIWSDLIWIALSALVQAIRAILFRSKRFLARPTTENLIDLPFWIRINYNIHLNQFKKIHSEKFDTVHTAHTPLAQAPFWLCHIENHPLRSLAYFLHLSWWNSVDQLPDLHLLVASIELEFRLSRDERAWSALRLLASFFHCTQFDLFLA